MYKYRYVLEFPCLNGERKVMEFDSKTDAWRYVCVTDARIISVEEIEIPMRIAFDFEEEEIII